MEAVSWTRNLALFWKLPVNHEKQREIHKIRISFESLGVARVTAATTSAEVSIAPFRSYCRVLGHKSAECCDAEPCSNSCEITGPKMRK
jgi:hypothetical protein